jgi:hypothetical protein
VASASQVACRACCTAWSATGNVICRFRRVPSAPPGNVCAPRGPSWSAVIA